MGVIPVAQQIVITKPEPSELKAKGVFDWPLWEKGKSVFPWIYTTEETCYIIEGKARVTTLDKQEYLIGKGDMVVFPMGLECTWEIIDPITKHYQYT